MRQSDARRGRCRTKRSTRPTRCFPFPEGPVRAKRRRRRRRCLGGVGTWDLQIRRLTSTECGGLVKCL